MRTAPHTISTRVTARQKLALETRAREIGTSVSSLVSRALVDLQERNNRHASRLLLAKDDHTLASLIAFLGLPPNASAADVQAAVAAILGAAEPPAPADAGATGPNADVPPAIASNPVALSRYNAIRAERRARATAATASRTKIAEHSRARAARTK